MPYEQQVVSLNEARNALDQMLQIAQTKYPNQPVTIAIVDPEGEPILTVVMDQCPPQPRTIARKKPYTAARTRTDTVDYAQRLQSQDCSVLEFGEPNLVILQGGVAIPGSAGTIIGGLGVSGLTTQQDEEITKVGLVVV